MGNCFKKPSAKERLLQLDKSVGSIYGEDSVYDTIYDMENLVNRKIIPFED